MKTWSLESAFIRAYSAAAVGVQGLLDLAAGVERITRPLGHDVDYEAVSPDGWGADLDGAERLMEREAEIDGWEPDELRFVSRNCLDAEDCLNPGDCTCHLDVTPQLYAALLERKAELAEPGLSDDELVGVRGLLQERYETSPAAADLGGTHSVGAAGERPPEVDHSPDPSGGPPDWHGWAEPAICTALAGHLQQGCRCSCGEALWDAQSWREHVGFEIANRIACDPARAIAALRNSSEHKSEGPQ